MQLLKLKHRPALFCLTLLLLLLLSACAGETIPTATVPASLEPEPVSPTQPLPTAAIPDDSYPAPAIVPPLAKSYPAPATAVVNLSPYPEPENGEQTPVFTFRVLNSYPHDTGAFTQGLLWDNGVLYESTGNVKTSTSLRQVNLEDGEVLQIETQPDPYFGEGLVLWDDKLIQLTWRDQVAFVYDRESFAQIGQFEYETEGWGLTHDGRQLIMSDGSNILYFRDPETFAEMEQVPVFDGDQPVFNLNELEYIDGEVWANIWQTNRIARIDPDSGQVTAWVDLTGLLDTNNLAEPVDVLNGIAYDADNERLFVTGKLWPALFEIEVVPLDQ